MIRNAIPPKDFKILVANFEGSNAKNYSVTDEIFRNLERMEKAFSLNPELREFIKTAPDFDAIREGERFRKLIEEN